MNRARTLSEEAGKAHWAGDRKQTTLWQISQPDQDADTVHGTQKPVECMRRPILNNSSPGQAVYEPFMGSGTTLIAAETTGRVCLGIELNPAYVDVAVERWQRFTGQAAVLDGGGREFRRSEGGARSGMIQSALDVESAANVVVGSGNGRYETFNSPAGLVCATTAQPRDRPRKRRGAPHARGR